VNHLAVIDSNNQLDEPALRIDNKVWIVTPLQSAAG
jgi:hypothetical protein